MISEALRKGFDDRGRDHPHLTDREGANTRLERPQSRLERPEKSFAVLRDSRLFVGRTSSENAGVAHFFEVSEFCERTRKPKAFESKNDHRTIYSLD